MSPPKHSSTQSIWKSSLVITSARLLASGCAFLLTWLIARRSIEDLGVFRTLFVFFLICDFLPLLGLQVWLFREIAVRPAQLQKYLFHSALFGLGLSGLGIGVLLLLGTYGQYSSEIRQGLLLLTLALPAAAAYVCGISALVGLSKGTTFGLLQAGETIVRMAVSIVFILRGAPIIWIVGVFIVVRWTTVFALWVLLKRGADFSQKWTFDPSFFQAMLRQVPTFAGIAGLALVIRFAAAVTVPWVLGDTEAGELGAAYMLVDLLLLVPTAFVTALVPRFSTQATRSLAELQGAGKGGVKLVLLFMIPAVAHLAIQAPALLMILFETSAPSPDALPVMRTLIWIAALLAVDQLLSSMMISAQRPYLDLLSLTVGSLITIGALLIGTSFFGVIGAAGAVLLGVSALLLTRIVLMHRTICTVPWLELLWRPGLATLAMAAVMGTLPEWHWTVLSAVGIATYLAAVVGLGALSLKERRDYQKLLCPEPLT